MFLNPLMLLGLTAVSVPIIIHLLNKRKFERVVWAAMRFLKISVEQNQRRIQIEDILLLLLRCLLVALLALALARPAWRAAQAAGFFGQAKVTGVLLLDNSYSMSGTDGARSRFEQAKTAAEQVVNTLPSGSSLAVILASDSVHDTDKLIPEPTYDMNLVRKTLREARLSDRASDLAQPIRTALDTLEGRASLRKEIYVVTDNQALGWRQRDTILKNLSEAAKAGKEVGSNVLFVGSPLDGNLGVSDLRLASDMPTIGRPLRYDVRVTNYGQAEARDVLVKLRVDNDPPSDEATIESIPPGAAKSVSLHAKLRDAGYHTVTAALPPDHLPADDVRTIAVRGVEKIRVLLVDGDPGRRPSESETYFLKNILQPVPLAEQEQYYIQTQTVGANELDSTKFDDFDAIFLCNVADVGPGTLEGFASYLRRGRGGLVIFPGPNSITSFYNNEMGKKYHFLPATLGDAAGKEDQEATYFTLQDKKFEHPIAAIWSDAGAGTPASAHFYRAFELTPATDGPTTRPQDGADKNVDKYAAEAGVPRTVLSYAKGASDGALAGKPAVMERAWGQGRVVLFSSTASRRWNDLVFKPAIFPLVYRTLGSVVGRQDEALNIRAGSEKFVYRLGEDYLGKEALIYKPGQREQATDARRVEMSKGNNLPTLTYDQTDGGGEYKAAIADPPTNIKFAVQGDPIESGLDELNADQKKSLTDAGVHVIDWKPGMAVEETIEKQRVGTELWMYLAFLVAVLATAETFLAHWFSRAK